MQHEVEKKERVCSFVYALVNVDLASLCIQISIYRV